MFVLRVYKYFEGNIWKYWDHKKISLDGHHQRKLSWPNISLTNLPNKFYQIQVILTFLKTQFNPIL